MNDNKDTMFAGGIVLIIIVCVVMLKAIEKIFIVLGEVFTAIANAAASFFMMAWYLVLALGLVAVGIGCVYGAVYFTYRYYLMVKRGTDLKQQVDQKLFDTTTELKSIVDGLRQDTKNDLRWMSKKLSDALDKPEIAPMKALPNPETDFSEANGETEVVQPVDQTSEGNLPEKTAAEEISPSDVANPF